MSETSKRRFTAQVYHGDGAVSTIQDPQSFDDGGVGWVLTYGDPKSVGVIAAGLLESFDYLISSAINMTEATRRLRQMRAKRRELCASPPSPVVPATAHEKE